MYSYSRSHAIGAPFVWRLSADVVLHLSALDGAAQLLIFVDGDSKHYQLAKGKSILLTASSGEVCLLSGEVGSRVKPILPLCRLLAFLEYGFASLAPASGCDTSLSILSLSTQVFETRLLFEAWFLRMWLFYREPAFLQLLSRLRGLESYWLIRYLLSDVAAQSSLAKLGEDYGVSPAHFRRLCLAALGQGAKSAMIAWRARRALLDAILCRETLTCIAIKHGYASSSHYSNEIRRQFGFAPHWLTSR